MVGCLGYCKNPKEKARKKTHGQTFEFAAMALTMALMAGCVVGEQIVGPLQRVAEVRIHASLLTPPPAAARLSPPVALPGCRFYPRNGPSLRGNSDVYRLPPPILAPSRTTSTMVYTSVMVSCMVPPWSRWR